MDDQKVSRKEFLKKAALGTAGITLGLSAKSYSNIIGANDRIHFAIVGLHNRGKAHMAAANQVPNAQIDYVCDVDSRVLTQAASHAKELTGNTVKTEKDIRRLVEQKDIDAITVATPDHWHTPMTLLGVQNGKHVYVEKPCCHNPAEGEMLVAAQQKYNKVIQMGTQTRSAPGSFQAIHDIRDGLIGEVYMGKAWYSNDRTSIGVGKQAPVPDWLDWNLWQGPAPHEPYEDIWVHYNWHWFWNWGTGEINNNGIHEMDICRWALGLDDKHPIKVTSSGGRYAFNDDWQFYDTQVASFEYEGDKMISWEGKSCNPFKYHGRGRGLTIHGTKGTVMLESDSHIYRAYDLEGNKIREMIDRESNRDTTSIAGTDYINTLHFENFANAIREGVNPHSPIDVSYKSNLLCHLGNYAQKTGDTLHINPENGHIKNNPEAMKMWEREYEPGWEPKV